MLHVVIEIVHLTQNKSIGIITVDCETPLVVNSISWMLGVGVNNTVFEYVSEVELFRKRI